MQTTAFRLGIVILGPILGVAGYMLAAPWWIFLIAFIVFFIGLISFSSDNPPERNGYEKRQGDGSDSSVAGGSSTYCGGAE